MKNKEQYEPIEGAVKEGYKSHEEAVMNDVPVEKRYAGEKSPTKMAQEARAKMAGEKAVEGTVHEFNLPEPQAESNEDYDEAA